MPWSLQRRRACRLTVTCSARGMRGGNGVEVCEVRAFPGPGRGGGRAPALRCDAEDARRDFGRFDVQGKPSRGSLPPRGLAPASAAARASPRRAIRLVGRSRGTRARCRRDGSHPRAHRRPVASRSRAPWRPTPTFGFDRHSVHPAEPVRQERRDGCARVIQSASDSVVLGRSVARGKGSRRFVASRTARTTRRRLWV